MSQTQLKFRYTTSKKKVRNYKEIQKSVKRLFEIFEEYGRLEKKLNALINEID